MAFSALILFWAITSSGHLSPGEDAIEPLALFSTPFVINVLYTLGWLAEIVARHLRPQLSPRFGPFLLMFGMGLGLTLMTVPVVLWCGFRLFQGIVGVY